MDGVGVGSRRPRMGSSRWCGAVCDDGGLVKLPIPLLHVWRPMKWGSPARLDCRECRVCGRFEVYAYSGYRKADRARFTDAVPA
jgi:hypothetical protein